MYRNVKHVLVHLAIDHLGESTAISAKLQFPVVCRPEVAVFLTQQGAYPGLMRTLPWDGESNPRGIRVRSVEYHQASYRQAPNGKYLSGQPLSFIIYPDPSVRIYHSGDSAIFSDLKLIGELNKPNIRLITACELKSEYLLSLGLQDHMGNEMNGDEGDLAALWLGVENAIICHYINGHGWEDVQKFINLPNNRHSDVVPLVMPLALRPGEIVEYQVGKCNLSCSFKKCYY